MHLFRDVHGVSAQESLLLDQIDDPFEAAGGAYGDGHGHEVGLEVLFQVFDGFPEIRVVLVHLVHEHNGGHFTLREPAPGLDGANLYARFRRHDEQSGFGGAQSRNHLTDEVAGSRRVEQVDLRTLPVEMGKSGVDRDPTTGFFVREVTDGLAGFDGFRLGDLSADGENLLDQGCLPGASMTGDGHVTNSVGAEVHARSFRYPGWGFS